MIIPALPHPVSTHENIRHTHEGILSRKIDALFGKLDCNSERNDLFRKLFSKNIANLNGQLPQSYSDKCPLLILVETGE